MDKQGNPGLWIGAAALAAVIVMLVVMPERDPSPPRAANSTDRTDPKTPEPATEPQAVPTTPPATPQNTPPDSPPVASVATIPPVPPIAAPPPVTPARDPDDAPPAPPPKPITPADRENTARVLDNIQFALRDYRSALGENPVGTNAEITSSLLGNNRKQAKIPLPDGATVNGAGEMCDPWGSPYFFHQQSGTKMEIRSAGPDRKMWTPDDVMM